MNKRSIQHLLWGCVQGPATPPRHGPQRLANVLFVYEDAPYPVLPYFGGGVGWARAKSSLTDPIRISSEAENVFAYHVKVGIKLPVPYAELDLGYRLMGTSEIDDSDFLSHNVEAGITLRF